MMRQWIRHLVRKLNIIGLINLFNGCTEARRGLSNIKVVCKSLYNSGVFGLVVRLNPHLASVQPLLNKRG